MDWIDKFPLQSTEKYIPYPMINRDAGSNPGQGTNPTYCRLQEKKKD